MNNIDISLKDGIVFFKFPPNSKINYELSVLIVKKRLEFQKECNYPVFFILNNIVSIDKKAKNFLQSKEAQAGIVAGAFFTNSFLDRFIANIFIRSSIKKIDVPVKVFNSEKKAINWLSQYIDLN